jgi:hypothetical protein
MFLPGSAETVRRTLKQHGVPKEMLTDNGRQGCAMAFGAMRGQPSR